MFRKTYFSVVRVISRVYPFKPKRCIKASFYIPENRPNFPTNKGFRMKISMKLVFQYLTIFFNFQIRSSHLYPLQVENCDSNSRLVVDKDDNGKFRPQMVNSPVDSSIDLCNNLCIKICIYLCISTYVLFNLSLNLSTFLKNWIDWLAERPTDWHNRTLRTHPPTHSHPPTHPPIDASTQFALQYQYPRPSKDRIQLTSLLVGYRLLFLIKLAHILQAQLA